MKPRIITDIVLFCFIFLTPWWCVMALGAVAAFYFADYYELIALGLIIDSLYNAPVERLAHVQFVTTLIAIIVVIVAHEARTKLRLRADRVI